MKRIERLAKRVDQLENQLDIAVQDFAAAIVWCKDIGGEPTVSLAGDGELIAVLPDGKECPATDIVRCMTTKGFVELRDFI